MTTTTTTTETIAIMRVGRGEKLHIQYGSNVAATVCGTGNFHGMHTLGNDGRFPTPRKSGQPEFDSQREAAAYLAMFLPRNACKACLKATR
jgi:hypothetical protein